REIRIHAGLTARDLGRLMGRHGSKISRIEHGTVTPSAADIRTWCTHCGAPDEAADLVASALVVDGMFIEWHRIERTGLRQEQEAILPIFDRTQRFRAYSSWLVPGVLQTSAYTRAVLEEVTRQRGLPDDISTTRSRHGGTVSGSFIRATTGSLCSSRSRSFVAG